MSTRLASLTIPQLYRVCAALWPYSRPRVRDLITRKEGFVLCKEGDFDNFFDLFWPMLPEGKVWLFYPLVDKALVEKACAIGNARDNAKRELPYRLSIVEEARRALRKEAKQRQKEAEAKQRAQEELLSGAAMQRPNHLADVVAVMQHVSNLADLGHVHHALEVVPTFATTTPKQDPGQ